MKEKKGFFSLKPFTEGISGIERVAQRESIAKKIGKIMMHENMVFNQERWDKSCRVGVRKK